MKDRKEWQMQKVSQKEIDICIHCEKVKCYGDCDELREFKAKENGWIIPRGFAAKAKQPGQTINGLARYYGVTKYAIRKWLGEKNISIEGYKRYTIEEIADELEPDMSISKIRRRFHCGAERAQRALDEYERRRKSE